MLKIYDACNQTSAARFVYEVIRRLPFRVPVIQTDNGAEFQSHFHWHLEQHDIRHVYVRPGTPRLTSVAITALPPVLPGERGNAFAAAASC